MILKNLNIKAFGAIKNRNIDLEDGINIIYGNNESGKSTIEGFIRTFLYGITSGRKSIRENERKKFIPWDDVKAQGELSIEEEDQLIIISRTFGNTKKEDTIKLINGLTGENIGSTPGVPGREFLDLSKESFMKTLLIKQLDAQVARDKEEEIIQKLTNLQQGGDENVSYHKAVGILEEYKRFYIGSRKKGQLENLRETLQELSKELREALNRNTEGLQDEILMMDLKEKKENTLKHINALELYKSHMKKLNLQKEYKEISKYLKRGKDLSEERNKYEEDLGYTINNEVLEYIQESYNSYINYKEQYDNYYGRFKDIEKKLNLAMEDFKSLEPFQGLEEDVEIKVIRLIEERKGILTKLEHEKRCKDSLNSTEEELENIKEDLKIYSFIDGKREAIEILLNSYEEVLKELKYTLNNYSINENIINSKVTMDKKRFITNVILSGASIGTIIWLMIFIKGNIKNGFYYIIPFIFIAIGIVGIKGNGDIKVFNAKYEEELKKKANLERLSSDLERIEENFKEYYKELKVEGYEEFVVSLGNYDKLKEKQERLKDIAEEKLIEFNSYEGETLKNSLNTVNTMIDFLLNHTNCKDEEEFLRNNKLYKEKQVYIEGLEKELENLNNYCEKLKNNMEYRENLIKEQLNNINKQYVTINKVPEEIENLKEKLKIKASVEEEIKRVEESYNLLLKDRNIEDIKKELDDIVQQDLTFDFEKEEDVDSYIRDSNEDLRNIEKNIKDVENSILNRFKGFREPWIIEEEIEEVKENIKVGEEMVEVVDIALDNLNQCFRELQKDFGPKLNTIVSSIYNKLTNEKYGDVKVDDNYNVLVRDKEKDFLVEIDYLSNGAFDQAYFALRMALIEMIFGQKKVPIILDDTFVQYDDERTIKALELLYEYSHHKQIILLTCQKREKEYFKDRTDVNIINMEDYYGK